MPQELVDAGQSWLEYAMRPWFAYQLVLIALLFLAAKLIARRLEASLEERARQIRGQPAMLRVLVALLRRVDWILFVAFQAAALVVLNRVTWPSNTVLVSISLSLALAWLVVTVASRIIRNRFAARLVQWLAWIYACLTILDLDDDASLALESIALPLGTTRLTVLLLLKSTLLLIAAIWLAVMIGNMIDDRVKAASDLTPSLRVLIGKIVKFALIVLAGTAALSAVGVDLTALTVFSGAVGVGVGFGLQKVVSNFVSGIIILLDKSIKPGDTISLGETFGWIRDLRARFVSIVTRDGREYLIPNEDFITQQVINWSFSDELVRLDVKFGVSYDANPHQVSELAIKAAMTVSRVEASRTPVCWLTEFGDSSLDFVLRFWIKDPQQGLTNVRGKVLLALWDAFQEAGIAIPYPHREIVFKTPIPESKPRSQRRRKPAG